MVIEKYPSRCRSHQEPEMPLYQSSSRPIAASGVFDGAGVPKRAIGS